MRFNGLDLNLLVVLDALLREGSISRAATRVRLSQPATSAALARLREYFDDRLFVQIGRTMTPTPLAESLRDWVSAVLSDIDTHLSIQASFDPATSTRTFRLVANDYTTHVIAPKLVERVQSCAPGVKFVLLRQGVAIDQLQRGEADLVVVPELFRVPDHPSEQVMEDEYVCVVWSENREIGETIDAAQYQAASHIKVQMVPGIPSLDDRLLATLQWTRRVAISTGSLVAPPMLVIGSRRVATVHRRIAALYTGAPIRILPFPAPLPKIKYFSQWHTGRSEDEGVRWLRSMVKEVTCELMEGDVH
jgi:DNA-binding transcriptional LysR family regulator